MDRGGRCRCVRDGAIGVEMLEAWRFNRVGGMTDVVLLALFGVQEALEMFGAILATAGC